jgi:hypothetical protein
MHTDKVGSRRLISNTPKKLQLLAIEKRTGLDANAKRFCRDGHLQRSDSVRFHKSRNLPKVTQLINGKMGIQTQATCL